MVVKTNTFWDKTKVKYSILSVFAHTGTFLIICNLLGNCRYKKYAFQSFADAINRGLLKWVLTVGQYMCKSCYETNDSNPVQRTNGR